MSIDYKDLPINWRPHPTSFHHLENEASSVREVLETIDTNQDEKLTEQEFEQFQNKLGLTDKEQIKNKFGQLGKQVAKFAQFYQEDKTIYRQRIRYNLGQQNRFAGRSIRLHELKTEIFNTAGVKPCGDKEMKNAQNEEDAAFKNKKYYCMDHYEGQKINPKCIDYQNLFGSQELNLTDDTIGYYSLLVKSVFRRLDPKQGDANSNGYEILTAKEIKELGMTDQEFNDLQRLLGEFKKLYHKEANSGHKEGASTVASKELKEIYHSISGYESRIRNRQNQKAKGN